MPLCVARLPRPLHRLAPEIDPPVVRVLRLDPGVGDVLDLVAQRRGTANVLFTRLPIAIALTFPRSTLPFAAFDGKNRHIARPAVTEPTLRGFVPPTSAVQRVPDGTSRPPVALSITANEAITTEPARGFAG